MTGIIDVKKIDELKSKTKNKKIVLAGGCFDVLHSGHVEFLKKAKGAGDILIILLEHDKSVRSKKGKDRPFLNQKLRSKNLSDLKIIDYIVLLPFPVDDAFYFNLTKLIEPDIIAITKGDPLTDVKKKQVEGVGGKILSVINRNKKYSSSKIINKK